MNAYLKELTFHIVRHTFATTITLTNGVLIVSKNIKLLKDKFILSNSYIKIG